MDVVERLVRVVARIDSNVKEVERLIVLLAPPDNGDEYMDEGLAQDLEVIRRTDQRFNSHYRKVQDESISISREARQALMLSKRDGEDFSSVILRLTLTQTNQTEDTNDGH